MTTKNHVDDLEHYMTTAARLSREAGTRAIEARKSRNRADRLERAIVRHSAGRCSCRTDRECLVHLARLVPARAFNAS